MSNRNMYLVTVPAGFESEAKEEIRGLAPNACVRNLFFKGNLLVECPRSVDLSSIAETNETVYVGKIFPIDKVVKISKSRESIAYIHDEIVQLDKLRKGERFVVRCRRRGKHEFTSQDVERELGSMLEKSCGALADLRNPQKIVTVQIFQNKALIGVSEASKIVEKKIKVFKKYKHGERPLTRAEHKIREAIKIFGLEIKRDFRVLDLGAAPGGWTKVLASLAGKVVAVDPADLNSSVKALPNVTYLKCKAEEIPKNIGRFDLIVNDMNLDPSESARIMVNLAGFLKKGAPALMTIKFVTRNRKKHIAEALEILKAEYKDFKVKRLPHNRYETTVFMRKA
ncbi:methyltransferase domain-containing protein [Candidatus Bathyarchaeota archaeon]|nr:methyltransferase domain-containing protein [Candidatus Bathyarchaeota archaeon]